MTNMLRVEQLIDNYVTCWIPTRPTYSGLWENNDFGCEHFQIFQNGFDINDFSHDELSLLGTLLTRELRGQINRDHYLFWAYCAFLTINFKSNISLFSDGDWEESYLDLINLILSSTKRSPAGPVYLKWSHQISQFVNHHLLESCSNKWNISGPLVFSVLEGLLRRKNSFYVDKDGVIRNPFSVVDSTGRIKNYSTTGRYKNLNRVNDSIRCLEQCTLPNRGRPLSYLTQFKSEFATLYPSTDIYDTIDNWRNNMMHGNEYWQNRSPILVNLICMLIIDEIEPALYDSQRGYIKTQIDWYTHTRALTGLRARWDIFPPDI